MDTVFLEQLWALAVSHSVAAGAVIGGFGTLLIAVAWLVWWLRGHIDQGQIKALEERLRLAADQQKIVTEEANRIKEVLPNFPVTNTSAVVAGSITAIQTATTQLGMIISLPADGPFELTIKPTKKSH